MPDETTPDMAFPSFPVYPATCDYSAIDAAEVLAEQGPPRESGGEAECGECYQTVHYRGWGPVVRCCCGNVIEIPPKSDEPFIVGN